MSRARWYQAWGPWPLRPWPVAILASGFFIGLGAGTAFGAELEWTPAATALVILPNLAGAMALGLLLFGWRLVAPRLVATPAGYLLATGTSAIMVGGLRVLAGLVPEAAAPSPFALVTFSAVRVWLLVLIALALTGITAARLKEQVRRAEAAVELTRHQQVLLVEADERVRQQISALLHDRVQARLFAACLQLQEAVRTGLEPEVVQGVIDALEEVRALDVRRAARSLSPALGEVDLSSALEELAVHYEPAMRTTVVVADGIDDGGVSDQARLGCFRIVEQALLNAAIHGRARHCRVSITRTDAAALRIEVADDGGGLSQAETTPGLGSALISTWTRALDGEWALTCPQGGGTTLVATLAG